MEQWPGFSPQVQKEVFEETKTAGAQVIKLKGGSGFAVGLSIREVVESILLDSRRVLLIFSLATIVAFSTALFGPAEVSRHAFMTCGFTMSVMWSRSSPAITP